MAVTLTFSEEEIDELERLLTQHEQEMLVEIHRTERADFRLALQRRHDLHERILKCISDVRRGQRVA
jgi:hypothetical protein